MEQLYKNIFISFIVMLFITGIVFLIYYPGHNEFGNFFGVTIIWMLIEFAGLILGSITLLLRIIKVLKIKQSFFYVFVGTLNLCIGLLCLVMFMLHQVISLWLLRCLVNFAIGL